LGRALWGRTGVWGARGWLDEAKGVESYFRKLSEAPK
jgi:hypothetical protein